MFTLNCKGRLINWEQPIVMGILNATPDSFHVGSRIHSQDHALEIAAKMIDAGASILDIGGQSTRPGSEKVSFEVEAERILPIIETILKKIPETLISVDTYFAEVARLAVQAGASIVNDVSAGLYDVNMLETVAALRTPYICMHHGGNVENLHNPLSGSDLMIQMIDFFIERIDACKKVGINDLVIDPGFGFGKTISENFKIIQRLGDLKILNKPILLGVSRKSSIYKTLNCNPEDALNGTTVLHSIGLMNGAQILRVHDVREAIEAIQLIDKIKSA